MDDQLLFDGQVAIDNIAGQMQGLELGKSALFFHVLLQIATFTEFCHDVNVVFGHEYFNRSEDMWVCEGPEGIDLIVE